MRILPRAILALSLVLASLEAWGGISPEEYAARRARLLASADTDAAIVFHAGSFRVRSGDVSFRFRQESDFLYLTGISEPDLILLLVPRGTGVDGAVHRVILFAPSARAREIGASGTFREGAVVDINRFEELFPPLAGSLRSLYLSPVEPVFVNDWLNSRAVFFDQESRQKLREKHPALRIRNAGPLVAVLRECKSPAELELIRSAIRMTGDGIRRAMGLCRPGAKEYELQAAVEYEMMRQGADYTSFPSIIGSGPNSVILHYDRNRREMGAGEVVVMDVGAEFGGYAADVTRTIPVSGKFTEAQRKVYATVLKAQQETIRIIRPGTSWSALEAKAREVLAGAGFAHSMPHGVSHHVGVDVHDTGTYDTLKAGMVITVEPGIYIGVNDTSFAPPYRGFGVRIEDDVLVTPGGAEVLSSGIPSDIGTIEKLLLSNSSRSR